jgi:hypothetical protein
LSVVVGDCHKTRVYTADAMIKLRLSGNTMGYPFIKYRAAGMGDVLPDLGDALLWCGRCPVWAWAGGQTSCSMTSRGSTPK